MYAIIRAGGKQAKVKAGDIIEIERVKDPSISLLSRRHGRGGSTFDDDRPVTL